jgi:hypothetical protein
MYALGTAQSDVVNATPIRYVVWPAGDQADRYDVLQNRFYFDGGNSTVPPESEAAFAGWCRSVGCHAILTVPGEIDNASYAQAEVAYTENTLGFHPDYWQVGNEPARWIHFGLPWSAWNSSQKANATPVSYASAVGAYAAAMRAADPSVRILGLPGVGTGVVGETTWIEATVGLNGPNLSGVSIHVYPAGHASNGNESLATFLGSLTGAASLPARVPADRAAIAAACANCTGVRLFVTEMNSGSVSGLPASSPEVQFVSGYPDVPYIAAQTIQAMALNLTNMDLYALESTYAGSLINGTDGSLRPLYQLYAGLLPHVDDDLVATQLNGAPGGLYAIAAENPATTNMTLLVANANPSASAVLDLAGSGFFAGGAGGAWTLDSSSPLPVRTEWAANAPSAWTVPPLGVALLVGSVPVAMPGLALLADP